jgi:hypothetical protein
MPTPDESIERLKGLMAIWDAHGETVSVPKIGESVLTGVAIQVQVEHAVRLSEAVIALARERLFIQTAPLVRMALECAVSAAWWSLNPDNVKGSIKEAARLKKLLHAGMSNLASTPYVAHPDWSDISEEYAAFQATEAGNFEARCKALQGGESLYPYYRLLSEASHGGTALLDEYMETVPESDANPFGLAFKKHSPYRYFRTVLAICVLSVALAMRAWDDITSTHPDRDALNDLATEIGAQIVVSSAL